MNGKLITFEGGEGAGKTTQIEILENRLKTDGHTVLSLKEPGTTKVGQMLRTIVKNEEMTPLSELFIFEAARAELVNKIMLPKLNEGYVIICDRFYDSTFVYQGLVRKLPLDLINMCNKAAANNLVPDLTLILDVDSKEGVSNALEQSRFEKESEDFHKKINFYFRNLKSNYFPERNIALIPRLSINEVSEKIYTEVKKIL